MSPLGPLGIALLCLCPLAVDAQGVPDRQPPMSETAYPYVVGLGAIAGVVTAQALLFGVGGFPLLASSVATDATISAEVSVGLSRIYAVSSAVTGAWIANWIYDH